jgi:drug/metabolite transporter (DMT)-like permease
MADLVVVDSIGYKRRNPWGVFGLTIITLGVYYVVWWYKVNNELRNYGIQNDPTMATLAITLGSLIIVPPYVSTYKTADRILKAQEQANAAERINPLIALLIGLLAGPFVTPYMQSQLNKVWDALVDAGAEVQPA